MAYLISSIIRLITSNTVIIRDFSTIDRIVVLDKTTYGEKCSDEHVKLKTAGDSDAIEFKGQKLFDTDACVENLK